MLATSHPSWRDACNCFLRLLWKGVEGGPHTLVAVAGQGAGQALHLGAMAAQSIADTVNLETGEGFAAYRFIATNGDEAGNRVRSVLLTNTVLAHRLAPGPDR